MTAPAQDALHEIAERWRDCQNCALREHRTQVVNGDWWSGSDPRNEPLILVIGEAPGRADDEKGIAGSGKAGDLLRKEFLKLGRVQLAWIETIVGCRSLGDRPPAGAEISACAPRLAEIAAALEPQGIITLDRLSADAVKQAPWAKDIPAIQVTHPAVLMRQGHPTALTMRSLRTEIAKIARFVKKLKETAPAPSVQEAKRAKVCEHDYVTAGEFLAAETSRPLIACRHCTVLQP